MARLVGLMIPFLAGGGAERVCARLSKGLSKYYDVKIILYEQKISYDYQGDIVNLNLPASGTLIKKTFVLWKRVQHIKNIKRQYNFETVVSFLESTNIVNLLSKQKEKVILSVRVNQGVALSYVNNWFSKYYNFMIKRLYPKADKIVAVSEGVKKSLTEIFNIPEHKITVIYNPYDIEHIERLAREKLEENYNAVFKNNKVIITCGRLSIQKGYFNLIKVFGKVKNFNSNLKLVVLGDGEERDFLIKFSKKIGLNVFTVWDGDKIAGDEDIYFLGFQKNPFKFIARAHVFVLSSLWEGFPNVLVEAMICGTPVVSSDCKSGPREILAPNTDLSSRASDVEFARYGVLLPPFDDSGSEKSALSQTEKIWLEFFSELSKGRVNLDIYKILGKKRSYDFSQNRVVEKWKELL